MSSKRLLLTVRGRVQGVYFRASTLAEATRLGLAGWVKNTQAGHVELCAEGEETALHELLAWSRRGPPSARVDGIQVEWAESIGDLPAFAIVD